MLILVITLILYSLKGLNNTAFGNAQGYETTLNPTQAESLKQNYELVG